jgi:hypothetical protein
MEEFPSCVCTRIRLWPELPHSMTLGVQANKSETQMLCAKKGRHLGNDRNVAYPRHEPATDLNGDDESINNTIPAAANVLFIEPTLAVFPIE